MVIYGIKFTDHTNKDTSYMAGRCQWRYICDLNGIKEGPTVVAEAYAIHLFCNSHHLKKTTNAPFMYIHVMALRDTVSVIHPWHAVVHYSEVTSLYPHLIFSLTTSRDSLSSLNWLYCLLTAAITTCRSYNFSIYQEIMFSKTLMERI